MFRRWTLVWLGRDLEQPIPGAERRSRRADAHVAVPLTDESLDRLHPYFASKLVGYRRLLKSGAQGMGAEDSAGVVYGVMWVSTKDLFDDLHYRCWFRINPGEVLQFAGEIAPDRRGGLAAVRVQRVFWNEMLRRGYERTVCVVETGNTHSLSLHFSLGFSERGMITEVYRFFRVFSFVRHRRYEGARFEDEYRRKASRREAVAHPGSSEDPAIDQA
ncbi:MAG: hypothetical protein OZ935_00975 [Pseudomonadota bacterium]|nr:hypothetical protein [Pseudomonadota bacterium]